MPIMPLKRPFDRYAALAWTTSLAVLALEKVRRGKALREEETQALQKLTAEFELLSASTRVTVDQISGEETGTVTPELLDGFFTLTEIEETSARPITESQLRQAGADLQAIQNQTNLARDPDPSVMDRAQDACLQLLTRLDRLRPEVVTP